MAGALQVPAQLAGAVGGVPEDGHRILLARQQAGRDGGLVAGRAAPPVSSTAVNRPASGSKETRALNPFSWRALFLWMCRASGSVAQTTRPGQLRGPLTLHALEHARKP